MRAPFQILAIPYKYTSAGLLYCVFHRSDIDQWQFIAGGGDEAIILKHSEKLCHFHIHDATGRKNHLPLGEGEIDLRKYLSIAQKLNCRAVLETKTVDGLSQSVKRLRNIFDFF